MKRISTTLCTLLTLCMVSCKAQTLPYDTGGKSDPKEKTAPADTPATKEPVSLSFSVENSVTESFIDNVTYPDNDYSYTKITSYSELETSYDKDCPAPAKIRWNVAEGTVAQVLYVSTDPSFKNPASAALNAGDTQASIWNLTPGVTVYAKVCATLSDGTFTVPESWVISPTGRVRMLYADGVFNIRDLGGWKAEGGKKIKYGTIFRGGSMNVKGNITDLGKQQLLAEGIGAVCDLRMDSESNNITASLLGSGVDFWRISDQIWAYVNAMTGKGDTHLQALQWIIDELKAGKKVYFHCSRGADRTGTMAFMLECLLGVSESDLAKEYELTSFSTKAGERDRIGTSDHNYSGMIQEVKKFEGTTLQDKMTGYLLRGINGTAISQADIDFLKANLLE